MQTVNSRYEDLLQKFSALVIVAEDCMAGSGDSISADSVEQCMDLLDAREVSPHNSLISQDSCSTPVVIGIKSLSPVVEGMILWQTNFVSTCILGLFFQIMPLVLWVHVNYSISLGIHRYNV